MVISFFAMVPYCLMAQDKKKEEDKSYLEFSLNYLSNSVYMGRGDSLATPYLTPTLTYNAKSGFYISGSVTYLHRKLDNRIDYSTLEAGWDFDITKKLSGSITANRVFYHGSATAIRSDIRADIGGSLAYDFGLFTAGAGADLLFDSRTDIAANGELSRSIEWGEEGHQWTLTPAIGVNYSTLNFFAGFAHRRISKRIRLRMVTKASQPGFMLLDYEMTLPITYEAKKWGASITGTYAIPQSTINTSTNVYVGKTLLKTVDSTPYSEKHPVNMFYYEIEVHYKF